MVLPLVPLGLLAVPFMTKANTNQLLIAGGIAFLLWQRFGFDLGNVANKVNILPEAKNFGEGLFNIDPGVYAEDQSGSPNPPSRAFWEAPEDEGPVAVWDGLAVPTPPIISTPDPRSPDRVAGQATNNFFTNPIFYPWFWAGEKLLESAAPKTNADRFQ
jgi:hypothetical protein